MAIEFLKERPKGIAFYLPPHSIFFVIRHEGEIIAGGVLVPGAGFADLDEKEHVSLQLQVFKWTHSIFKVIREDWVTLLDFLREKGWKKLIVTAPDWSDQKFRKFIAEFGFNIPVRRPWKMGGGRYFEQDIR